ncbi:hypothetical protein DAH55_13705 [Sphingomonas koreensis]|uniref:hypothetical protein n=1 Tax=Sphingomonas koreensis TaxID=93064 RepID=UPI00082E3BFC|nr:hypothetical protein [Sphingomonas koreensis]PJI88555.1 hypothetical protein BDW16_1840 [Sphingomonas koreensis]RSU58854.1 hypothetical protein DAH56_14290 [Sphingomonas koreensis]RSU67220.1 hypothetical protein DAH55_13705 [Sphingomonas koreensis]
MQKILIRLVEMGLFAALFVAAKPLLDFLILPPPEQARQWMITVIALGAAGGLYVARRNLGADQQQP